MFNLCTKKKCSGFKQEFCAGPISFQILENLVFSRQPACISPVLSRATIFKEGASHWLLVCECLYCYYKYLSADHCMFFFSYNVSHDLSNVAFSIFSLQPATYVQVHLCHHSWKPIFWFQLGTAICFWSKCSEWFKFSCMNRNRTCSILMEKGYDCILYQYKHQRFWDNMLMGEYQLFM